MIVTKYHGNIEKNRACIWLSEMLTPAGVSFFWNAWVFCKLKNRDLEIQRDHGSLVQNGNLGCRKKGPGFKPLTQWYAGETPACPLPMRLTFGFANGLLGRVCWLCFQRINKRFRKYCPNTHYEIDLYV
jgi:hypothetical protein